jgi:hypothetical protein
LPGGAHADPAIRREVRRTFGSTPQLDLTDRSPQVRPSDRDLVTYWLQRNDAQNYVLLGDPAARIRNDLLV